MKKLLFTIFFAFTTVVGSSQLSGPSPVLGGSVQTYTYSGGPVTNPFWRCLGGSITSYNSYYSATITWNTTSTDGSVLLFSNGGSTLVASKSVAIFNPPTALAATNIASTSFTANWSSVSSATSYRLDVSTSSNFSSFVTGYNNLTVNGTTQAVTGLLNNTTYYYRVRAVGTLGTTGNSNTITAGTGPAAPASNAATNVGSLSFTASWNAVSGASFYQLDVSTSFGFATFLPGYSSLTIGSSSISCNVGLTSPLNAYYYRVRAVNSSGNPSSNSETIMVMPAPAALPAANVNAASFTARWKAVTGVTSYRLDVSSISDFSSLIYNNYSVSNTSQNVTGLSGSTSYYYRVRAVSATGTSANSNTTVVINQNYIRKAQSLKDGVVTQAATDNLLNNERVLNYEIYDGLGRISQKVTAAGSPSAIDIVQPIAYDQFDREVLKYLPYTSSTAGIYKNDPLTAQATFYTTQANVAHDSYPWAETVFDNSALNAAYEQGETGQVWQVSKTGGVSNRTGHTIRYLSYENIDNNVYLWICDETNRIPVAISSNRYYSAGALYVTRTFDENAPAADPGSINNWIEEYKDKDGRIVLKRTTNDGSIIFSTYYVYDNLGMLRYVIPPLAAITTDGSNNSIVSGTDFITLCYAYLYDKRLRLVQKRIPGADSLLMVYDQRDRLVGAQDGVQRSKSPKEWTFIKYDTLDRPILTGTIQSANTRAQMQTAIDGYTKLNESRTTIITNHYYTDVSFPNSTFTKTYLTVNYYDDYDCNFDGTPDYSYTTDPDFPNNSAFLRLRNKQTVNKVRQLDPASGTEVWFITVSFYDKFYQIIQMLTSGIQGGTDLVTNEINFPGWLIRSKETQTVVQGTTNLTNYVLTRNEYDHQGRLLNTYHKINTGAEKNISNLTYNELGQLLTKKQHVTSGTGLQKIDYTYNIRGWLKKINEPDLSGGEGDLFGTELLYNEGFSALNGTAMYNGNISGMKWKNGSSGSTQKGYGFLYDQVNRLTTSKYGEGTSYTTNVNRYDENLAYDKNGNIRKLYRNGQISTGVFGNIDSLEYKYPGTGNQVWAIGDVVTDVAGRGDFYDGTNGYANREYYYDKNGNMWLDRNKRMKTEYNYLNLPARISDTITPANKIEYVYTSAGKKLKQRLSTGTTLLYLGNFVYTLDGTSNGISVKYILTQEGRATYSAGTYTYEYFMKDHLGNTRVSFNVPSTTAVIVQQSDYYPFGMIHQPQATTASDNRYLYNGKEFQNNLLGGLNLDWYDYGARMYDPQIGRFHTQDAFAEKYIDFSPYQYAANNPLKYIDINGDSIYVYSNGQRYYYGYTDKYGYGMYDKSGQLYIGNDQALNAVNGALARLSLGTEGKALVGDLMNNTTKSTTILAKNVYKENETDPSQGSWVRWNPSNFKGGPDQNGSTTRDPYIGLAHELGHVQDIWNGTVNHGIWQTVLDESNKSVDIQYADIYATHVENKIRAENGVPLRVSYCDNSGRPDNQTRIIRAGTAQSVYVLQSGIISFKFNKNGNVIYTPLRKNLDPYIYH